MEKEALFLAFNLITRAYRNGWVISFCVCPQYPRCEVALGQLSGPVNLLRPFPPLLSKRGSAGSNFPPENTNSSSIKLLPAEPFVSGLNYPVAGAFHLDPSLSFSVQMGPGCTEGNSFSWGEWKSKYTSTVCCQHSIVLNKTFYSNSVAPGPAQACSCFFIAGDYPLSSRIKTFLGLLPLVLVGVVFPQRWDNVTKVHLKGLNGWEPPANPILISWR